MTTPGSQRPIRPNGPVRRAGRPERTFVAGRMDRRAGTAGRYPEADPPDRSVLAPGTAWWRRLRTVPGVIAATALTTLAGWGTTLAVTALQQEATARDPLTWTVESNPAQVAAFAAFPVEVRLPAGARPVTGPGPGCRGFRPWGLQHDGIDAGITRLQLVLQSRSTSPLLIADARAVVVGRNALAPGIGVRCPPAGEAELRPLSIDLERPDPRAVYGSEPGRQFGFTLEQGEIESFLVTASARTATYAWYLELTVIVGGEPRTVRIDDGGSPFRTTSPEGGRVWEWDYEGSWFADDGTGLVAPAGAPLTGDPP